MYNLTVVLPLFNLNNNSHLLLCILPPIMKYTLSKLHPEDYFYRPQRSCSKFMFLHLSVSHSFHRGVSGRHPGQTPPWADTPSRHLLGRHTPWADTNPGQTPPQQTPPQGRHHPGIHPPWQTSPLSRYPLGRHPPPPTATAADGTHPTGMLSCLVGMLGESCEKKCTVG